MDNQSRKIVKKYRKGNIPAAFSSYLWFSGSTILPNLLVRYYSYLGITDVEMMTLVQLIRMYTDEKDICPDMESLAECMSADKGEIAGCIHSLLEKKILAETLYYNEEEDTVRTGYDFEPLFEKLADHWAWERACEIEKAGNKLDGQSNRNGRNAELAICCNSFEKEFGRPLSPIELEKIAQWVNGHDADLILEALRRAVFMGKRNFRYIDTILLDWKRNNITGLDQLEVLDRHHQNTRKPPRENGRSGYEKENQAPEKRTDTSKRKALLKKLYLT